jgi:hypothetical protein
MVVGVIVRVGMFMFVAMIMNMLTPSSKVFSKQPYSKDHSQDAGRQPNPSQVLGAENLAGC